MRCTLALLLLLSSASPLLSETPAPEEQVAASINAFAFDLYQQLSDDHDNLVFSPFSISAAMAMAKVGAGGETGREMREAMRFPQFDNHLHTGMSRLIAAFDELDAKLDDLDLQTAAGLWVDDSLEVQRRLAMHLQRFYGTEIGQVGFSTGSDEARKTINDWASEKTGGKIPDLLAAGSLNETTRLVVATAIYFRDPWLELFDRDGTQPSTFHRAGETNVSVAMMHEHWGGFRYLETDVFCAVEIPYRDRRLSMIAFVPREGVMLASLEDSLAASSIAAIAEQMTRPGQGVHVYLPRFRIEASFDLADALSAMGMTLAFSVAAETAGFGADVRIDAVAHHTFFGVDEDGTEAAGANALVFSGVVVDDEPVVFRADRPFVFLVRDAETGVILFLGRVMDPTA